MLPEVEKLLIIQNHDQKIRAIDRELEGIPREEEDNRRKLVEDEEAAAVAKQALRKEEVLINSLEIDVQTRRDSIAKLKTQQFETRKNEEFWAMGEDIKKHEEEIAQLEDREMERMETAEELEDAYQKAVTLFEESKKSVAEALDDLATLRKKLESEKSIELDKRGKAAGEVDQDILELYERLFHAKHGVAVVGLIDGGCSGCHMKVVQSTVIDVKSEKSLTSCENCGRILYWWTDEDS